MTTIATRSLLIVLFAVCALTTVSNVAAAEIGDARGVITVDGQPLGSGKITLHRADGQFFGSKIKDGKYAIDCLPAGEFKVTIEGQGVPAKYGIENATEIVVSARGTRNEFSFALSSK